MRLQRRADVARVHQEGRSWAHPLLVLLVRPNGLQRARVAVVASRRLGKATARNRAKRLLREAARHVYPELMPGWDLLLIARPKILEAKEPQVRQALGILAREAGLVGQEQGQ